MVNPARGCLFSGNGQTQVSCFAFRQLRFRGTNRKPLRGLRPRYFRFERERRLPSALLAALIDAGLFRLLLPRSLDGAEVDPVTFVRVIEAVSSADASTAWCLCQTAGCSMVAAYLRPAVAREIFGRDPRAILAWGPASEARAIAVDGGYRVTGTWNFASGGRHATWLGGYCPIGAPDGTLRRGEDGTPVGRTMLFPATSATMHRYG